MKGAAFCACVFTACFRPGFPKIGLSFGATFFEFIFLEKMHVLCGDSLPFAKKLGIVKKVRLREKVHIPAYDINAYFCAVQAA